MARFTSAPLPDDLTDDELLRSKSARLAVRLLRLNWHRCPTCDAETATRMTQDQLGAASGFGSATKVGWYELAADHDVSAPWEVRQLVRSLKVPERTFLTWVRNAETSDDWARQTERRVRRWVMQHRPQRARNDPSFIDDQKLVRRLEESL